MLQLFVKPSCLISYTRKNDNKKLRLAESSCQDFVPPHYTRKQNSQHVSPGNSQHTLELLNNKDHHIRKCSLSPPFCPFHFAFESTFREPIIFFRWVLRLNPYCLKTSKNKICPKKIIHVNFKALCLRL